MLIDTVPLSRLLRGDKFLQWLISVLQDCKYRIESTEAVLVETLYFVEKSGLDLDIAASKLLALLKHVEALRDKPLRSSLLVHLGYTDTELLLAAKAGNAVMLASDERLALEAQSHGINAYAVDWLLSLEPDEITKLLCYT